MAIVAHLGSCKCSSKLGTEKKIDWATIDTIKFENVEMMADQYKTLISTNSKLNVREINLSAAKLAEVAKSSSELRLIMGAKPLGDVVIMLQRKDFDKNKKWYYLDDLFMSSQPGSGGKSPLCNKEPVNCVPTFPTQSGAGMSSVQASKMADEYFKQSNADYDKMILQIDLQPDSVLPLLANKFNVKLISAVSEGTNGTNTLLLEFTDSRQKVTYVDLKTRIPSPVCPPPPRCDLTQH